VITTRYDVRPSARRRGHATAMPAPALPVARGLGIDRVLVTCDVSNTGSRKVVEANGGGWRTGAATSCATGCRCHDHTGRAEAADRG
jgi:predicted acetyltransferase